MGPEEIGRWLFSISKHLKSFADGMSMAFIYATKRSAQEGELLLRIRGLRAISYQKLEALALDINIPSQELPTTIERLEKTGLVSARRTANQGVVELHETILTEQEVYRATAQLFEILSPRDAERAILPSLDLLSRLPLTKDELLELVCKQGFTEEVAKRSLELQHSFRLTQEQRVTDMGIDLLYNEYLWGHKIEKIGGIIAKLPRAEKDYLLSLMEEVKSAQGQSLENLSSAPKHIVALAANKGILDTTTITTSNGKEKTFVFSPNFYGYRTGKQPAVIIDPADQVRLFVASMMYGTLYSEDFRLHSPLSFINSLIQRGRAGNATPILRDYILLERQGIVRVEQLSTGRGTFILCKRDVVEKALDVMRNGSLITSDSGVADTRSLISQKDFRSPEENRLNGQFGQKAGNTASIENDLIASIREEAQNGTWSN